MKHLFRIALALLPFAGFSQQVNNSLRINAPRSADTRTTKIVAGKSVPYASVAEANAAIVPAYRYIGLEVNIGAIKYYYRYAVSDTSLVPELDYNFLANQPDLSGAIPIDTNGNVKATVVNNKNQLNLVTNGVLSARTANQPLAIAQKADIAELEQDAVDFISWGGKPDSVTDNTSVLLAIKAAYPKGCKVTLKNRGIGTYYFANYTSNLFNGYTIDNEVGVALRFDGIAYNVWNSNIKTTNPIDLVAQVTPRHSWFPDAQKTSFIINEPLIYKISPLLPTDFSIYTVGWTTDNLLTTGFVKSSANDSTISLSSDQSVTNSGSTISALVTPILNNQHVSGYIAGNTATPAMAVAVCANGDYIALFIDGSGVSVNIKHVGQAMTTTNWNTYLSYPTYNFSGGELEMGNTAAGKFFIAINGVDLTGKTNAYGLTSPVIKVGFGYYSNPANASAMTIADPVKTYGSFTAQRRPLSIDFIGDSKMADILGGSVHKALVALEGQFGQHVGRARNLAISGAGSNGQLQVLTDSLDDQTDIIVADIGTNDAQSSYGVANFMANIVGMKKLADLHHCQIVFVATNLWYDQSFSGGTGQGSGNQVNYVQYKIAIQHWCASQGIPFYDFQKATPAAVFTNDYLLDNIHSQSKMNDIKGLLLAKVIAEVFLQDRPNYVNTSLTSADLNGAIAGTINSIPKFTSANGTGNSQLTDDGQYVALNGSNNTQTGFIIRNSSNGSNVTYTMSGSADGIPNFANNATQESTTGFAFDAYTGEYDFAIGRTSKIHLFNYEFRSYVPIRTTGTSTGQIYNIISNGAGSFNWGFSGSADGIPNFANNAWMESTSGLSFDAYNGSYDFAFGRVSKLHISNSELQSLQPLHTIGTSTGQVYNSISNGANYLNFGVSGSADGIPYQANGAWFENTSGDFTLCSYAGSINLNIGRVNKVTVSANNFTSQVGVVAPTFTFLANGNYNFQLGSSFDLKYNAIATHDFYVNNIKSFTVGASTNVSQIPINYSTNLHSGYTSTTMVDKGYTDSLYALKSTVQRIVGIGAVGSSTAATSITSYTAASAGTFCVSANLKVNSVTTDVIRMKVTYTDPSGTARTAIFYNGDGTSSFSTAGVSDYSVKGEISIQGGTTLTVLTELTTGGGTISYNASATILQNSF